MQVHNPSEKSWVFRGVSFLCRQIHPEMRENPTWRLQDAELFGQGAKASHYSYGSVIISPRGSMPFVNSQTTQTTY